MFGIQVWNLPITKPLPHRIGISTFVSIAHDMNVLLLLSASPGHFIFVAVLVIAVVSLKIAVWDRRK